MRTPTVFPPSLATCTFLAACAQSFRLKKGQAHACQLNHHFRNALRLYDELVDILKSNPGLAKNGELSAREIAEIYLGRSETNLALGQVDAAYRDACKCAKGDVEWYKVWG